MHIQRGHLFCGDPEFFSFPANFSFPPPRRGLLQSSFVAATMETGTGMGDRWNIIWGLVGLVHCAAAVKSWEGGGSGVCLVGEVGNSHIISPFSSRPPLFPSSSRTGNIDFRNALSQEAHPSPSSFVEGRPRPRHIRGGGAH